MNNKDKWIRLSVVLGISTIIIYVAVIMVQLLYPFLFAIIFALIINPFVNIIVQHWKVKRGLAVFIIITLLITGLGGLLFFLSVEIISGIQYLLSVMPADIKMLSDTITHLLDDKLVPILDRISSFVNGDSPENNNSTRQLLENFNSEVMQTVSGLLESLLQSLLSFIQSLPHLAASFLFGLLGTFFISKDWYSLKESILKRMPVRIKESGLALSQGLKNAFVGFIKAQIILVLINTVLMIVGLFILQVKHPLTIGLIIGGVEIIPYFGGLVLVMWSIYSLITENLSFGIGLAILYIVGAVVRHLIEPKLLSSNIGLNTLATLVAMFVGIHFFGFLGLIIGPVALVIFNTFRYANIFKDIWFYIQHGKIE